MEPQGPLTNVLRAAARGDPGAADELLSLVYQQLRAIAAARMRGERPDHTLQATALVHEAYLKLISPGDIPDADADPGRDPENDAPRAWGSGRAQFFYAAGEAMRRILIDHARKHNAVKRGGGLAAKGATQGMGGMGGIESVAQLAQDGSADEIVALDAAFVRLEKEDPHAASVVRFRFFAGLTVDETAAAMGRSRRSVLRDWEFARAFLLSELESGLSNGGERGER